MIKARLMNQKEIKKMQSLMKEQYDSIIKGVFYQGSKGRVYLTTHLTKEVNLREVNADGIGLYIGRINKDGFRPSIEGIQLIRPKKNVFELSKEQLWDWLKGFKIKIETEYEGYCALKYKKDLIGPGKISNGYCWNYVPKERRIKKL